MTLSRWIFLFFVIVALSGCGTGGSQLEVETQPAASAVQEADVLAEIQPVVEAVLSERVDRRREFVDLMTTACTTREGLGGPPKCIAGETDGTLVEVLPVGGSEGTYLRREQVDRGLDFSVQGLYAVYREEPNPEEQAYWPSGGYVLIFEPGQGEVPFPISILLRNGRIVRLNFHQGVTAEDIIAGLPENQIVLSPDQARALNP